MSTYNHKVVLFLFQNVSNAIKNVFLPTGAREKMKRKSFPDETIEGIFHNDSFECLKRLTRCVVVVVTRQIENKNFSFKKWMEKVCWKIIATEASLKIAKLAKQEDFGFPKGVWNLAFEKMSKVI